jgi:hypothetical protein
MAVGRRACDAAAGEIYRKLKAALRRGLAVPSRARGRLSFLLFSPAAPACLPRAPARVQQWPAATVRA